MNWFPPYNYILASQSPRRQKLFADLGIPFTVKTFDVPEVYPKGLRMTEIPIYLAVLKAEPFAVEMGPNDMVIAADTIVWIDGHVLGKPKDEQEARYMLHKLSGRTHQVVTGVCLKSVKKQSTFHVVTHVDFKKLQPNEIDHYLSEYKPFDKAGAYGIQEWIGLIGVSRVEGSYFNVVGLPVQRLYTEIMAF